MTSSESGAPVSDNTPAHAEPVRIEYVSQSGLGAIAVSNFILNLITLWIYRFWAKTRVRRHIWSCVHINGEPVEYTGTGGELFTGFLVVMAVLFLPLAVIGLVLIAYFGPESPILTLFQLAIAMALVTLYGFAIYRVSFRSIVDYSVLIFFSSSLSLSMLLRLLICQTTVTSVCGRLINPSNQGYNRNRLLLQCVQF